MTISHNPFMLESEALFICYDEIIKNPYPLLLYQIITKYKDIYSEFLNLGTIEEYDFKNLERFCIQRKNKNILRELAKKDFDYIEALVELKKQSMDLYTMSDLWNVGNSINMLMNQKFVSKIYLYTEVYDARIHIDIQRTFKSMKKINYVFGNFIDAIRKLPEVTCYMINDVHYMPFIFDIEHRSSFNVLVANYGYNYRMDVNGNPVLKVRVSDYKKKHKFEFGTFMPLDLTPAHFTQIIKG